MSSKVHRRDAKGEFLAWSRGVCFDVHKTWGQERFQGHDVVRKWNGSERRRREMISEWCGVSGRRHYDGVDGEDGGS